MAVRLRPRHGSLRPPAAPAPAGAPRHAPQPGPRRRLSRSSIAFAHERALLAAGLLLAGSAGAATTLTVDTSGNAVFGMTHGLGSFMDDYTFSVSGPGSEWATVSAIPGVTTDGVSHFANYAINDVTFYKINSDSSHTLLTSTATNMPSLAYYPIMALAAGNYGFTLLGSTIDGKGGAYSGTLNLAPVPEPAGYAMLGIGLGLLGFAARRQRNNKLV